MVILAVLLGTAGFSFGDVYLTEKEALDIAFPKATAVEPKTLFLTEDQIERIQKKAKSKLTSEILTYYVGHQDKNIAGYAFIDTHTVRTMAETIMVVLDGEGKLEFVEILAFHEPRDYIPPKRWRALFKGKELNKDLWVKRGIRNIAGSTLSTQAMTLAVRRILSTYEEVIEKAKQK